MAHDETEPIRRKMVSEINSQVSSSDEDLERQRLKDLYGQVWDTVQLSRDFLVEGFMAPYVVVVRKIDQVKGSLMFQHHPRFYFGFKGD